MQQLTFDILENSPLAEDVFRLWLKAGTSEACSALKSVKAGQFVNIGVKGCFLRRPISICDVEGERLCLVYKVVGKGTAIMADMSVGEQVDMLLPLGNGFNIARSGAKPLLVGGGVGVPPLLLLFKQLKEAGKTADVVLGFNKRQDIILADEFRRLGCEPIVATIDGSEGYKGFVTDALRNINANANNTYYYSCGPIGMLRAVKRELAIGGELSMEERMGCGFGVCMGCTCHTQGGARQVCTDGPVFGSGEVIFEEASGQILI